MSDELRDAIAEVLGRIAPEADLAALDPKANLRDELDLDSMDHLNFVIGLHERFGIDIPEADYPQLATLAGALDYLARRGVAGRRPPAAARSAHEFTAELAWKRGAGETQAMNHTVRFEGRPPLEVSAAPQYKGDPSRLNPEELFVASLATCQLLTYLALAPRRGVTVLAYDDHPVGTLAIVDKKRRMSDVLLRPRITVDAATDLDAARALVDAAHDGCFVGNSILSSVRIEPEIVRG